MDSVEGWFYREDILLFEKLNELQRVDHVNGDLLEIGAYHGKSAILLGYFRRKAEQLVVCDLFETPGQTLENRAEKEFWYSKLTQDVFEKNYLRFHRQLPMILTCPSTKLLKVGKLSRTFRFIHIDGSHVYSIVRQDIHTAKTLLKDRGIVAFDDYRSIHTPGVAAAVWEEVTGGDLIPLCLTPQKIYATWDTHNLHLLRKLRVWANKQGECEIDTDTVCGRKLLRIRVKTEYGAGSGYVPPVGQRAPDPAGNPGAGGVPDGPADACLGVPDSTRPPDDERSVPEGLLCVSGRGRTATGPFPRSAAYVRQSAHSARRQPQIHSRTTRPR